MKPAAIRQICISGSKVYYDWLEEKGKGVQVIKVIDKKLIHENIFSLRLSRKLFDTDAIYFKCLVDEQEYDTNTIKIVEYDKDKNLLIIKLPPHLIKKFTDLKPNQLILISDLKFLVERVRQWYVANGTELKIPTKSSTLKNTLDQLSYFKGKAPSSKQGEAIRTIFTTPFNYIWGPPGTGKTQFVLAYSLIHYIQQGKKVAVFAPTNNAIEQVLRGVIQMTDKASINRKKILRLGGPSKAFAQAFPEICEEKGLMKKIREIEKQIKILEKVIHSKIPSPKEEVLQKIKVGLENLKQIDKEKKWLQLIQDDLKKEYSVATKLFQTEAKEYNSIAAKLKKHKRKAATWINRFLRNFQSDHQTKWDKGIPLLEKQLTKLSPSVKRLQANLAKVESEFKKHKGKLDKNIEAFKQVEVNTKQLYQTIELSAPFHLTAEKVSQDIDIHIQAEIEKRKIEEALAHAYHSNTQLDLQREVDSLNQQKKHLLNRTTEERIKKVNVIAATLDCYIGRYTEEKLQVDHLFLDEAGYANIVKAMTLLRNDIPTTFLGDHLQLPPVCEMNATTIRSNESYNNVFVWAQSAIHTENLFSKSEAEALSDFYNYSLPNFNNFTKTDLDKTFRFGNKLAKVLNDTVYQNGFHSGTSDLSTNLYFIDVNNTVAPTVKRQNQVEAKAILQLIAQLDHQDYVILCPYTNQIRLISKDRKDLIEDQKLLTVHGSQGREWKTVILSVVDYDYENPYVRPWFTDSTNKKSKGLNLINTAVSRAKKELIIVCNVDFWKQQDSQLIKHLLDISKLHEIESFAV